MLSLFEQFQNGTLGSTLFARSHVTRRVFNFELSNRRDVQNVHSGGINSLDIERVERRYLLSGCNKSEIAIHDLYNLSGQTPYTCKAVCTLSRDSEHIHNVSIDTVQWYPFDTGMFTTSGADAKLKIWDSTLMKVASTVNMRGRVYHHHLSTVATNHNLIAAAMAYPHVVLVDIKSGSQSHELYGHKGDVLSAVWSPCCDHLLATSGTDNRIFLWDIRSARGYLCALDQYNGQALSSRKDLVTAHNGKINSLRFTPDGLYLLSFGTDHRLRLWDVAKGRNTFVNYWRIDNAAHKFLQMDLCDESTVPVVFVPSKSKIYVHDVFNGARLSVLTGHFGVVNGCVFRGQYHELYSGGFDKNILIWTSDVEQELATDGDAVIDHRSYRDNWCY